MSDEQPMMPCGRHTLAEAETAAVWDGLCPVCQGAELLAAREVVEAAEGYAAGRYCLGLTEAISNYKAVKEG